MLLKSHVLYFSRAFLLLLYNESTFGVRQLYFYCFLLLGLDKTTCEMGCTSHTSVNESTQITEKTQL